MNDAKPNFVPNIKIQNKNLYKVPDVDNIAKKHIDYDKIDNDAYIIKGEEALGIQRVFSGAIIITHAQLGQSIAQQYNTRQQLHIRNKTFSHKILCERRNEAAALLFLSIFDLVGTDIDGRVSDYKYLSPQELCNLVRDNIQKAIHRDLEWLVKHSRNIIHEYYNLPPNKLKIKLNFMLDDGIYPEDSETHKGGLLLNGFLDELEYYQEQLSNPLNSDIGFICQVLCPSGFIESRKWAQIDVGISLSGKRNFQETINDSIGRFATNVHLSVSQNVLLNAQNNPKLYYGGLSHGCGYEGYEIQLWEVFARYDCKLLDEPPLNYTFCKCAERTKIINEHKALLKDANIYTSKTFTRKDV
jgi:hypothetical protein